MKIRHIGIPTRHLEVTTSLFEEWGFIEFDRGQDIINGKLFIWRKMSNASGQVVEIIQGDAAEWHIAFDVKELSKDQYYYVTPSGAHTQWRRDISGNLFEMVKEDTV